MGVKVDCKKSAHLFSAEHSGFEILSYKYPWFMYEINTCGFDNEYIKNFVDTLESIMATTQFDASEFDDYYNDARDELGETHYDSLILLNSKLTIYQGVDLLKNSEFRMAVIDKYRSGEPGTFEKVKETYSNYLLQLNKLEVTDQDFKGFCHVFDSIMTSYGNLDVADPFLTDSLDNRMYAAMDIITSSEKSAPIASLSMKSAFLNNKYESIESIYKKVNPLLKQMQMDTSPKNVADIVMALMILEFQNADMIRNSVKNAYLLKNSIKTLPVATTEFTNHISNTSVAVKGSVLEDGGADVTNRGIVWGNMYNPDLGNQKINVGSGTGSFETNIEGLLKGETYYVRAFATNSVGTVYGNCVNFIAGNTVGVEDIEIKDIDFNIFPNPASAVTTFRFRIEPSENMALKIVNLKGQVVLQKDLSGLQYGENVVQLDLSELKNGIYSSILISNGTVKVTRKFLIAH